MAAANFVVITNGGGAHLLEQPISTNSLPRAFFPRVRLVVDYLEESLSVVTWIAWIGGTASSTVLHTYLWAEAFAHTNVTVTGCT